MVGLFDFLPVLIAVVCAGIAWDMLNSLGIGWKLPITGTVVIAAWCIARLLFQGLGCLLDCATKRRLRSLTADELEKSFLDPACFHPNLILLELSRRGQDIARFRAVLIERLQSDSGPSRLCAFRALGDAFPDDYKKLSHYSPYESQDICRRKTHVLNGK